MNLPSANRLWSETSGITSVFCRGYLMTDSNGVLKVFKPYLDQKLRHKIFKMAIVSKFFHEVHNQAKCR